MLLLIATYGLRSSEIVALTLDDFAWRLGELRVPRRKVDGTLVLPLTDAIGDAVRVCAARPPVATDTRALPPCASASRPVETNGGNRGLPNACAAQWFGDPVPRAHCLRHSLAVQLLRQGVSLKAIGDVLEHRTIESTCQYLQLATEDLRDVPLDLPDGDTEAFGEVGA